MLMMLCWGNHHHGVNALGVLIVVGSGAALNGCSDWDASLGAHRTLIVALEQRIGGASDDDFEIVGLTSPQSSSWIGRKNTHDFRYVCLALLLLYK